MSIPNILSIFRLLLIPFFTYFIISKEDFFIAGILLVISGITDYCDGFIARKFNMSTNLGKILDPLADKLTQLVTVICLAVKGYKVMWFLAVFLFIKDLILLIGGLMLYQKKDGMLPSNWFGKIATTVFYISVVLLTLFQKYLSETAKYVIAFVIILVCLTAFVSYVIKFFTIRAKKIDKSTCIMK